MGTLCTVLADEVDKKRLRAAVLLNIDRNHLGHVKFAGWLRSLGEKPLSLHNYEKKDIVAIGAFMRVWP